jgi:SP family arabinose:H+ symporter-like MFS transporter
MTSLAVTRDVLTTLDNQRPTKFYWQLTLLATLGGFLFGYDTSNIGSALNFVPYNLHGLALGYLVSGASLGAAAGAILGGPASDLFGRKALLIIDAGIYAAGAILSAVTPNAAVLLVARTLIGMAIGADSAIATAYIAEYAPKNRRGSLTMIQQWMITVGILVSYIVALIIFSAWPGSAATVGWRLVLGLGAVPALIGLAMRTQMPESPRWLLRHGRYDDVRKAMETLGAGDVSEDDVRRAAEVVERVEGGSKESRRRAWTPGVRRALVVVSVFFIFQQITGINVPLYYGPHILGPIFSGAHASLVQTTVAGVEVTAIMTAVNVASTYLGFRWIDKFGRKALAIGGFTGMIVFALVSALGLAFMSGTPRLVVIMIGLDFFIASFAIGVGGVGWTLQGEVFPTAVRGQAAAFCAMIDWLANFALIEVFPVWQNANSLGGVMVCFAALAVAAIAFVFWFLPETKGLPVEEIVRLFERQRGPVAPATAVRAGGGTMPLIRVRDAHRDHTT